MTLHDEDPYRPKIRGRRVYGRDELSFGRLRRQLSNARRSRSRKQPPARIATKPGGKLRRRVVVKAWYVRVDGGKDSQRSVQRFLNYMEKEGAERDGGQSVLYGAERDAEHDVRKPSVERDQDIGPAIPASSRDVARPEAEQPVGGNGRDQAELERELLDPIPGEKHQFRIVVSPADGDRLDLTRFVKELMAQVEKDVGQPLIWAAANHYDTDDPHAHIVIRGVDKNGNEVRFDRQYISRLWRERAEELATRELGPRTELEYQQQLEREIRQGRLTSLDRAIGKRAVERVVAADDLDRFQRARVKVLGEMGLARQVGPRRWALAEGWQQKLREAGERGDIIKQLHRAVRLDASRYRIVDRGAALPRESLEQAAVSGRVVAMGLIDSSPGRMYAVVETTDGGGYYVPLWHSEARALRRGALVTLRQQQGSSRTSLDVVLESIAKRRDGFVSEDDVWAVIEARLEEHRRAGAAERSASGAWSLRREFGSRAGAGNDSAIDDFVRRIGSREGLVGGAKVRQAVSKRLGELKDLGVLKRVGEQQRLEPRFLEEIARHDRANPRWRVVLRQQRLGLDEQVTYIGPTWLDGVKPRSAGGFASELATAQRKRRAFLAAQHVAAKDLGRLERQRVAEFHARQLQRTVAGRANGFRGTVHTLYEAHGGTRYVILSNATEVLAVRAGPRTRALLGREVKVDVRMNERDGKPKLEFVPLTARDHGRSGPGRGA